MGRKSPEQSFPLALLSVFKVLKYLVLNHIKCIVGLSLQIKFMMWGDSLSLWTVPYLNSGRMEGMKYVDGARCCHALNLRTSFLDSAVDAVMLQGGLKIPAATKAVFLLPVNLWQAFKVG